jgi:hypothetical protein
MLLPRLSAAAMRHVSSEFIGIEIRARNLSDLFRFFSGMIDVPGDRKVTLPTVSMRSGRVMIVIRI